jgi:stage V sporulation protein R
MSKEVVLKKIGEIEELAKKEGLDFFPVIFELVNRDIMLEACSYGLPVRARHWSYGRSYDHQKIYGEMGLSKVYEIVFNNDPSYAFLLNTNSDIINIMVGAHVFGHVHFFKHNVMFQGSDRNMIYRAAERASRIDQYIEQFGIDKVEHLMDIGFALDNHIDWQKGIHRKRYPERSVEERKIKTGEFEDLLNIGDYSKRSIKKVLVGDKIPPHPERDLLWFLINYAPLDEWEKDVLQIIREESYYFYPIVSTKIMNEGFASFWHAELMYKYDGIDETEFIEFGRCHSSVVQPGSPSSINPYYLGFKVFTDIRERWDKLHKEGKSEINGIQKIIQVAAEEDDASFLRNYLTRELASDLGLFNYGYRIKRKPDMKKEDLKKEHGIIEIKDRDLNKIIENITKPTLNYGAPMITVEEVDGDTLAMEHRDTFGPLDKKYTEKTMGYIYELWGGPIELKTYNHSKEEVLYCYDESGFETL